MKTNGSPVSVLPDPYNPWGGPAPVISDECFAEYQKRMKRQDLRLEAHLPRASVNWWKMRVNAVHGQSPYTLPDPSQHTPWNTAWREACNMLNGRLTRDHGAIIGLVGRPGTGKTLLATGLLLATTAELHSARYSTLMLFNLELEEALRPDSPYSRREVLEAYEKPRLLVLDDCSAGFDTEASRRLFRELIDVRYQARRDTVLISNVDGNAFQNTLGAAMTDRVAHHGGYLEFNWESFR